MMTKVYNLRYNLLGVKGISLCLFIFCGCYLQAQVLQPLGNGVPGKVVASYASGNDYLALYEDSASSEDLDYSLAKWNGLYWEYYAGLSTPSEVKATTSGEYNFRSIAIYNDEIYISAFISNTNDLQTAINHLYKWNGNNWENVLGAVSSRNNGIYDMTVWNGKLIVAGKFIDTLSTTLEVDNIAAYDGTDWVQLGSNNNNQGTDGLINVLLPAGNRLYVAGEFTTFGGTSTGNIAFYTDNNGNWGGIGSPFSNGIVDLALVGNTLWAMDNNPTANQKTIRSFSSSKWSNSLDFTGYTKAAPSTIAGSTQELYIGGDFISNSKVHNITVFKDNAYRATDNLLEGNFNLDQKGTEAYIWGDFKEKNTAIRYFSPIVSNAGNAAGTIFHDANNNCIRDGGEEPVKNVNLIFTNATGTQSFVHTDEDGMYSASLQPGLYSLNVEGGKHWKKICSASSFINSKAGEYSLSDIGLNIQPNLTDATVRLKFNTINKLKAGDKEHVSVQVYNSGSKTINGSVIEITHDPALTNFSSEPLASNYAGNKATFTLLDLKPRQSIIIDAFLTIPAGATSESNYPVKVSMGSLLNDNDVDLDDNADSLRTGPVDGSTGLVTKKAITGDTTSMTDELICYSIQCANGTGEFVKRIIFIDTLDADYKLKDIDWTYFSHSNHKHYTVGRVLVLEFPEANLADREAIPTKSIGAAEFNVVLVKNQSGSVTMPHGTILTNTAQVDFDGKVTHSSNQTRVLVYDKNSSIPHFENSLIKIYPNPSNGSFTIESKKGTNLGQVEVFTLAGERVFATEVNTTNYRTDFARLPANSYLLKTDIGSQIIQVVH